LRQGLERQRLHEIIMITAIPQRVNALVDGLSYHSIIVFVQYLSIVVPSLPTLSCLERLQDTICDVCQNK
jgi:hypothetical protein